MISVFLHFWYSHQFGFLCETPISYSNSNWDEIEFFYEVKIDFQIFIKLDERQISKSWKNHSRCILRWWFQYVSFFPCSSLLEEMLQFDEHICEKGVGSTTHEIYRFRILESVSLIIVPGSGRVKRQLRRPGSLKMTLIVVKLKPVKQMTMLLRWWHGGGLVKLPQLPLPLRRDRSLCWCKSCWFQLCRATISGGCVTSGAGVWNQDIITTAAMNTVGGGETGDGKWKNVMSACSCRSVKVVADK